MGQESVTEEHESHLAYIPRWPSRVNESHEMRDKRHDPAVSPEFNGKVD